MADCHATCPCGERLPAPLGARKFCSARCRYKFRTPGKRNGACVVCAREMHIRSGSAAEPMCQPCRRTAPPRTHDASGYRRGCRCAACKEDVAAKARQRYAQRRAEGRPASTYLESKCMTCEGAFNARKRDGGYSRYCSIQCANVARNLARGFSPRPPKKSAFRKRAEKVAKAALEGSSGGKRVWVQGACIVCEAQYLSPGTASRYCSRTCRALNRQRSFGLSWLDRMAIFARDGWACQICLEQVDYTADHLSDWYPSLDHIVPRAHGGSDDPGNLRTAHRWCNSVRGDLSHYTDRDLQMM